MVDRCVTDIKTPCTVVDLDGTYINGNTLKIYLRCGFRHLMSRRCYSTAARLIAAVVRRKLGLTDHTAMKRVILSCLYPYPELLTEFRRKALEKVNPDVEALIRRNRDRGHRILLATAAPDFYVRCLWDGDFVATEYRQDEKLVECSKDEKLTRVNRWLELNNCTLDTVVTDHCDDAPLISANSGRHNILVNPSKQTLRALRHGDWQRL